MLPLTNWRSSVKVGDLVKFKSSDDPIIGIIVVPAGKGTAPPCWIPRTRTRIGVLWADGGTVDYEPADWLEVISERRNRI